MRLRINPAGWDVITLMAVTAIVIAGVGFLEGVDARLALAQAAGDNKTKIERYCVEPAHVESLCQEWRAERAKNTPKPVPVVPKAKPKEEPKYYFYV